MNERIKAQLFALGLIDSLDASDATCKAALNAWFKSRGLKVPKNETAILSALQTPSNSSDDDDDEADSEDEDREDADDTEEDGDEDEDEDEEASSHVQRSRKAKSRAKNRGKLMAADEQGEARLEALESAAKVVNATVGREAITAQMVLDANRAKQNPRKAMEAWSKTLSEEEPPVVTDRISHKGDGASRFATDAVLAQVHRAGNKVQLTKGSEALLSLPLWAVAAKCLQAAGRRDVDAYSNREFIAQEAMTMGQHGERHRFYSEKEDKKYIQAAAGPATRPGDFPNILSSLFSKLIDTIELEEDYTYDQISALAPGGLNDFKPEPLINKGIVEELDEVQDADQIKELGLAEEVLSYLFMRRFANKFGWTPVLIANDNMLAIVESAIGLVEAWEVTQNRLVLDRITSGELLLDGYALYANRPDTGTAANDNTIASGGAVPSDTEWGKMEAKYADIGGVGTGRRVRGTLNTWFGPTGIPFQEARRTFMPLNANGVEDKVAGTTSNVGLYRGLIKVVPESELRAINNKRWFGFRSPTNLRTATVIRAYFNGFGTAGVRERWYDPETKTTWTSLEGRVAVATKNWRYTADNKGEA